MTFSGEDLEDEVHGKKEGSSMRGRKAPELSLEWRDVTIQIRYCAGPDDEEQQFVELFPKVMILMMVMKMRGMKTIMSGLVFVKKTLHFTEERSTYVYIFIIITW